jgi:hypothetical protein
MYFNSTTSHGPVERREKVKEKRKGLRRENTKQRVPIADFDTDTDTEPKPHIRMLFEASSLCMHLRKKGQKRKTKSKYSNKI